MSDSSDIDAAVSAALLGDAALMALAKDGVFFSQATPNATRFVVIDLVTALDQTAFSARAYEDVTYRVKYVEQGLNGLNAKAAAARIDAVLDGATFAIAGYSLMSVERTERVRYTDIDPVDPSIRWQHRGGLYNLKASL
jgi:hypothetical protein